MNSSTTTASAATTVGDCPNFSESARKNGTVPVSETSAPREQLHLRNKSVTVIVPVRNEEPAIAHTLDQLLQQERDSVKLEILVVDGHSTDKTREIVERYAAQHPEIRLLDNPKRLSSAARNIAIRESVGEYIVIIDGHCEIPSRRYFVDLVDAFEKSAADCLGRPQPLEIAGATSLQQAIALARSSRLGHHPESFIYSDQPQFVPAKSVAVAYRRAVFDKVGLFDEQFDAHEDGEFNYRCDQAGLKCYLDPRLTVKYHPRRTLRGLFQQMMRYGRGRVRLGRKHRGTLGLGSLIPAALVVYIVFGALASSVLPHAWIAYVTGLAIYLSALLASAATSAWNDQSVRLIYQLPAVLATVHIGAGTGTLLEFLSTSEPSK